MDKRVDKQREDTKVNDAKDNMKVDKQEDQMVDRPEDKESTG